MYTKSYLDTPSRDDINKLQKQSEIKNKEYVQFMDTCFEKYEMEKKKHNQLSIEMEKRHKEIFKIKTEIEILDAKIDSNQQVNTFYSDCG